MASTALHKIVSHCNQLLDIPAFPDYGGAVNGLQVENKGGVTRIAAAVDASLETARMATQSGADLLIVHHGFFWTPRHPWTGVSYRLIRHLIDHDLAVYSAHLPLDAHPRLGNNAGLCRALGLKQCTPFFEYKDRTIGLKSVANIKREALHKKLEKAVEGPVTLLPGGGGQCRHIGVVTGGAGGEIKQAADAGVDTFITGEGPHWTYALAEELGFNVFYAGHYATETFGVKSLAESISKKFKVPWSFIDHSTGL